MFSSPSVKVVILHEDGICVDGTEVVDESFVLVRGAGEAMVVLHG